MEPWVRDEIVILLGTFGACALLILGVLEVLWPSKRREEHWGSPRSITELATSRYLSQELARDRLSVTSVVGQQHVARQPRDPASRVADLR
jgi:hypothetical protein